MIPPMDFASELNVYLLLVRAVYNYAAVKDGKASIAEFAATCDQIEQIFDESSKVDQMTKN